LYRLSPAIKKGAGMIAPQHDSASEVILIVEDELLIRLDIADHLRTCGYRVIEAANASEAIAALQSASASTSYFPMSNFQDQWMDLRSPAG
jgi:CheY-like chemotaxis protein